MDWKFEKTEQEFKKIPVGKHRVRIEEIEQTVSSKGNDMLKITLAVSGHSAKVWHYIVFMNDHPEITNRNLTAIMDSFGLEMGNLDFENWKGKVGAAMIKYDENDYAKVNYFVKKEAQAGLPSWVEPGSEEAVGEFVTVSDDDLPF